MLFILYNLAIKYLLENIMNENILEKIDNISKSVKPIDDDKYQKAEIMLRSHSGHYITQKFCSASDIVSTINYMVNEEIKGSFDFSYEPIRINDSSLDSQIKKNPISRT